MKFIHQSNAESELNRLAESKRHSVLIEGPAGSGKSYLAYEYANKLGISDVTTVAATVADIRQMSDSTATLTNPMLICVENLDTGVPAASYTLLKFLEEPRDNVYVVVTCRNIRGVPETIISRSVCVSIGEPTPADLSEYGNQKDATLYNLRSKGSLWDVCRSFSDVDTIFKMSMSQLEYFTELTSINWKDSTSNLMWKLGHYADNSDSPLSLVFRYIYANNNDTRIKKYSLQCLSELDNSRIAAHAVLAHFVFNCKYRY